MKTKRTHTAFVGFARVHQRRLIVIKWMIQRRFAFYRMDALMLSLLISPSWNGLSFSRKIVAVVVVALIGHPILVIIQCESAAVKLFTVLLPLYWLEFFSYFFFFLFSSFSSLNNVFLCHFLSHSLFSIAHPILLSTNWFILLTFKMGTGFCCCKFLVA